MQVYTMTIVYKFDNKKLKKFGGDGLFDTAFSFIKDNISPMIDTGLSIKGIVEDAKDIKKMGKNENGNSGPWEQYEAARARLSKKKGSGFVEVKI